MAVAFDLDSIAREALRPSARDVQRARRNRKAKRSYQDELDAARERMAAKRAVGRDLIIPRCAEPHRREDCEAEPPKWMRTYLGHIFYHPFSPDHLEVIAAILGICAGRGSKKAIAAPRGFGKTWICIGSMAYAVATGLCRFPVILEGNAFLAALSQVKFKHCFEQADLLAEDYPEICYPIRSLHGAAQRANTQTVGGELTGLSWTGEYLVFPKVPGSRASGSVFMAKGMDSAIRGIGVGPLRPDFLLLNDPETRESVTSLVETDRRRTSIDEDALYLADRDRQIAAVYLGTIMRTECLAAEYTDPERRPAWQGIRIPFVRTFPLREEMWTQYVESRQRDALPPRLDPTGRTAHRFYLEHRAEMDAGAEVTDESRFDRRTLGGLGELDLDGLDALTLDGVADLGAGDDVAIEVSALQKFFNHVADDGWGPVKAEFQGQPEGGEESETSGITVPAVQLKLSHRDRGLLPADTMGVGLAGDVHGRSIYWVVGALRPNGQASVIDYGTKVVFSPIAGRLTDPENIKSTQNAILTALIELREEIAEHPYPVEGGGSPRGIDCGLVDSGWQPDPVYAFARGSKGRIFRASKGEGSSKGQRPYRAPLRTTGEKRVGQHYYAIRQRESRVWLYHLDADHWKRRVHDGFLTPAGKAGSVDLFGDDPIAHRAYAEQINAEIWTREFLTGKGFREHWNVVSQHNHYLDVTAGLLACGAILKLGAPVPTPSSGPQPERMSLAEMQRSRRRNG